MKRPLFLPLTPPTLAKLITAGALGFLLSAAHATAGPDQECVFSRAPRVFLSGELHGTDSALKMQELMIQAALLKKVYLGLETDPKALSDTLLPENRNAIFGMDEAFSKGFGVLYWSWYLSEKSLLMTSLSRADLPEAISSFHYFLLANPDMQKAWAAAKTDPAVKEAESPEVKQFVAAVDASLEAKQLPDQADLPVPIDSEHGLTASALVIKAVLRAYVNIGLKEIPETAPRYVPATLSRMKEILDYPKIVKGERNYYLLLRGFVDLGKRFMQLFVLDWRSEQMSRAVLRHLCRQQDSGLYAVPTVALVGGAHLSRMQDFLKARGVNASLDMQGAQPTTEFQELLDKLDPRF
jgi:hypothetical protein